MRFNVAALTAAVQVALDAHRANWTHQRAEHLQEQDKHLADWLAEFREPWLESMRKTARQLRAGQPVTKDSFPKSRDGWGNMALFAPLSDRTGEYRPPPELTQFLTVLGTISDDTVTTAGLRELGITASAMRAVTMHLARNTVASS